PAFLPILASTVGSILSESCVRSKGGVRWGAPNSMLAQGADCGSGPFTLTTWSSNQAIVLTRFDQYWRGAAKAPAVHILPVRVRRTFSYAFDYSAFLVNVTHDAGLQPRGPVPLGLPGYNASIPLFPFDLAQAATELNATPFWISGFNLTLYYRAGNGYEEQGCRLLANGLEALHSQQGSPGAILVGVRSLDPAAYIGALRAGGLPIALLSWAPRFADPLDSVGPLLRTGSPFPTWIGYTN